MTRKGYILRVGTMFGLFFAFVGGLVLGIVLQETGVSELNDKYLVIGILSLAAIFLVFTLVNAGKIMKYEAKRKMINAMQVENRQEFMTAHVDLNQEILSNLSEGFTYPLTEDKIYVVGKRFLNDNFGFFVNTYHELEMDFDDIEKELKDQVQEEITSEDEIDEATLQAFLSIPEKARKTQAIIVTINYFDQISPIDIERGRKTISAYHGLAKSLGQFATVNLYYMYDISSQKLYYEIPKRNRLLLRNVALNRFNKYFIEN